MLKGRRRTLPPRARRIAQREVLLTRMFVRLARRMLRVALAARAQMRMEPATMVPPRMFPLFTHNKRAIIVRSVLMVRPPSAARILLAMRMIARSFALSASDAAAKLTPQGAVCETGNADDSNYAKTLVIYDGDNADKAQKVADLLGCGTVMKNDGRYTYTGDILVVVGKDWK